MKRKLTALLLTLALLPTLAACGEQGAAGETRKPLMYLTIAGILNVILNLFFVIACHRAADGVAIASVIAQSRSSLTAILPRSDFIISP